MKLGKTSLLWILIIIFIVLWVPYFQNIGNSAEILFFGGSFDFMNLYPILLSLGLAWGFLLAVYVKSLIRDLSRDSVEKFDM